MNGINNEAAYIVNQIDNNSININSFPLRGGPKGTKTHTVTYETNGREFYCAVDLPLSWYKV